MELKVLKDLKVKRRLRLFFPLLEGLKTKPKHSQLLYFHTQLQIKQASISFIR